MDLQTAAAVLSEIATLLELHGENAFRSRAYEIAARALGRTEHAELESLLRSGDVASIDGIGPSTLSVLEDLAATGSSELLEQLREETPEGLIEMLRIPGLGPSRIRQIHRALDVESLHELEKAARDGRLAALPRFGPRLATRVLRGIAFLRESGHRLLYPHARAEAERIVASLAAIPGVEHAEVAGSLRRRGETIGDLDVVVACRTSPPDVAAEIARTVGSGDAVFADASTLALRLLDKTRVDVYCVPTSQFSVALWRATGSASHERLIRAHAARLGLTIDGNQLVDSRGHAIALPHESAFYRALGLPAVPPELREDGAELDAAATNTLPMLVTARDIRGALHCHSQYSDGAATIAELAAAARARGWSYLGVSDHSQSAFYAGGLTSDAIERQHDEIDAVNAAHGGEFRVLKGIEADILPCGRVDYDERLLDRFDYVIASVHSRFGMNEEQMTARVLKAMDDPHVTILGHPTGRLLLTRDPFAIDLDAILEKAADAGVAVELNADPHRLDLDWRHLRTARARGVLVEIGPDAHSVAGLDHMDIGVGVARKGWLSAHDVLNARDVDGVLDFARARRSGSRTPEVAHVE
jgi:DNA polymerase (family X)